MKVLLADGQELGFPNHYEMAKFLLFGAEKMNIPISSKPRIVATAEVVPLLKAKRKIQQHRLHLRIQEQLDFANIPF